METENKNPNIALGKIESLWIATTPGRDFPSLNENIGVDVAIIGGGISGITAAYFLKNSGLKVAVIDSGKIARGASGHTAGKITSQHQLIYGYLISTFGLEKAQQYADANQTAIETIASIVSTRNILCDFTRRDAFTYATSETELSGVEAEIIAAQRLKLPASFVKTLPLPVEIKGAIRFSNQAQMHPRKYLLALAETISGNGSHIFEKSRVLDIVDETPALVVSDAGKIKANDVIIATNYPFHDKLGIYTPRLSSWRAYMLGLVNPEPFPAGMYIGADDTTGHSFRSQPAANGEIILLGGEDHETGKGDAGQHFQILAHFARQAYGSPIIQFHWAGQYYNPIDRVPYIGYYRPENRHLFIVTGFGGWGLTSGTIAGLILHDLITGRSNPWASVYDSTRLTSPFAPQYNAMPEFRGQI
jgi:glycine/D-amino acid oxidase-like deaminating enzyme